MPNRWRPVAILEGHELQHSNIRSRSRRQFVEAINAHWRKAVTSIIRAGQLLLEAKEELPHGEWGKMFGRNELPFGQRMAQMLMKIAEHPILSNTKYVSYLPPSVGTLYELATIAKADLRQLLRDGEITTDLERKEVDELVQELRRQEPPDEEETQDFVIYDVEFLASNIKDVAPNEYLAGQVLRGLRWRIEKLVALQRWFRQLVQAGERARQAHAEKQRQRLEAGLPVEVEELEALGIQPAGRNAATG
jgi:hypothetical protein